MDSSTYCSTSRRTAPAASPAIISTIMDTITRSHPSRMTEIVPSKSKSAWRKRPRSMPGLRISILALILAIKFVQGSLGLAAPAIPIFFTVSDAARQATSAASTSVAPLAGTAGLVPPEVLSVMDRQADLFDAIPPAVVP